MEGAVDILSLEKSLKDLLSELKQTQTPLAFDTTDIMMSRPDPKAVQERVLHHNSEFTNFVSRLTEEKMELRNILGRRRGLEAEERQTSGMLCWLKLKLKSKVIEIWRLNQN